MMPRHPLVVKLKSGEYDGTDLMQAWLLIESQQAKLAKYEAAAKAVDRYWDRYVGFTPATLHHDIKAALRLAAQPEEVSDECIE